MATGLHLSPNWGEVSVILVNVWRLTCRGKVTGLKVNKCLGRSFFLQEVDEWRKVAGLTSLIYVHS